MTRVRVFKDFIVYSIVLLALLLGACTAKYNSYFEMSDSKKEALLIERATELWKIQAVGDRAAMYDYYDPFFRARASREFVAVKQVNILYYNPEVVSVDIKGNVAEVHVKMEYEIKGLIGPLGKPVDVERKENTTNETWLFIDGNWYRQFIDYITETSIADY